MIVINNLNPIFGDYFIELWLRYHHSCLLYRVISLCFYVNSWCFIFAVIKIYTYLALIFELVQIYIRHFHLLGVDRFISRPVIFLKLFASTKLFSSPSEGCLTYSLQGDVHVNIGVVIRGSNTNGIFSICRETVGGLLVLSFASPLFLTAILGRLYFSDSTDSHTTKRHLFLINFRNFDGNRHNSVLVALGTS
jgi:hypothetical protein